MTAMTCKVAPALRWVVQSDQIILMNQESGTVGTLEYPQAAMWDFISRKYTFEHIVQLMSAILSLHENAVQQLVIDTIEQWISAGFLVNINDYGESFDYNRV